jgi:hypothetical protein
MIIGGLPCDLRRIVLILSAGHDMGFSLNQTLGHRDRRQTREQALGRHVGASARFPVARNRL